MSINVNTTQASLICSFMFFVYFFFISFSFSFWCSFHFFITFFVRLFIRFFIMTFLTSQTKLTISLLFLLLLSYVHTQVCIHTGSTEIKIFLLPHHVFFSFFASLFIISSFIYPMAMKKRNVNANNTCVYAKKNNTTTHLYHTICYAQFPYTEPI